MERREFLKIAAGFVAGMATLAATAHAAPLMPQPLNDDPGSRPAQPAVTSNEEADLLQPEEVRWGRGRHRGWGRGYHRGWGHRHWGWRRRHWGWRRRRYWGWRRRRYWGWRRRRYWRRRYWRRRYYW